MAIAVLLEKECDLEISFFSIHADIATIELNTIHPITIFTQIVQIEIDAGCLALPQPCVLVQLDEYVGHEGYGVVFEDLIERQFCVFCLAVPS